MDYLLKKGIKVKTYNGYDISEEMLKKAKENLNNLYGKLNFLKESLITTKSDYTFVSDTFNVKFKMSKDNWKSFIIEKLNNINENSSKGFSFNLLTKYVDWEEDHLFYGDPLFFFDYCKRNFSRNVNLIHDYKLYE